MEGGRREKCTSRLDIRNDSIFDVTTGKIHSISKVCKVLSSTICWFRVSAVREGAPSPKGALSRSMNRLSIIAPIFTVRGQIQSHTSTSLIGRRKRAKGFCWTFFFLAPNLHRTLSKRIQNFAASQSSISAKGTRLTTLLSRRLAVVRLVADVIVRRLAGGSFLR